MFPNFIPEEDVISRPGVIVIRNCERSQIIPMQPSPTPTTAPVTLTLSPFLGIACTGSGFHTTDNAFINLSDSSLLSYVVETEFCSDACFEFGTCSAFTLFDGICTLYAGDVENIDFFYVEGSSLGIRCATTFIDGP